ncbi:hypothetical protein [Frigoriflavimonas asaccharolytica]|uniref:Uncharacterized protein n=1 Tax=Frigoriflavimonas asaccharolytica TaxID=2735899 RepID=A0A8J8G6T3_9FLAO|nr:hypothetical protein [Frigoriflavimonas asaccharolytica]NRS91745.1 hypothetical protein [Frigoriflavimonas asaccharolytica]
MKKIFPILLSLFLFTNITCSRVVDEPLGIKSTLSGNVINEITSKPVEGYKIKFVKSKSGCINWGCGISTIEEKIAYTDENGNYSIDFMYYLESDETYGLENDYDFQYVSVYQQSNGIKPGNSKINIIVWQPIKLIINTTVKNNNLPPVTLGNKLNGTNDSYFFGTENFYENNITKTVTLYTKPNNTIDLDYWYYENYNSGNPIRHLKSQTLTTGISDINLNLEIDCATF